jgi:hypothetical protein
VFPWPIPAYYFIVIGVICFLLLFLMVTALTLKALLNTGNAYPSQEKFCVEEHKNEDFAISNIPKSSIVPDDEQKEEVIAIDDYIVDRADSNRFIGKKFPDFEIRIEENKKNYDRVIFYTSLPHKMDGDERKKLKARVPQIVSVNSFESDNSHAITVDKSPSVKLETIKDKILRFIFLELYKAYEWKYEKQKIEIRQNNKNHISLYLRTETKYLLDLGRDLYTIHGLKRTLCEEFPLCMDHDTQYDFSLSKAEMYSWQEILPEVKKRIHEYFPAGVEFMEKTSY